MKNLYFLLILILFILIAPSQLQAENIYKKLSVEQCDSLINANEKNPDFVILDVRTPNSWEPDHLYGSICRNYYDSDFEEQLNALPKHKIYLLHCQSGGRSRQAFTKMQNLGFSEVYEMTGGISTWKSRNFPTTSVIEPKLMLVSYEEYSGNGGMQPDTIAITVTNRANDTLKFASASFNDIHDITNTFDEKVELAGAEDYSFYVIHETDYLQSEATQIGVESNGGSLDLNFIYENGVVLSTEQNQTISELRLYPNPASEYLFLESNNGNQFDDVSIISLTGRVVWQQSNFAGGRINISSLPSGIYLTRTEISGEVNVEKIVVKH